MHFFFFVCLQPEHEVVFVKTARLYSESSSKSNQQLDGGANIQAMAPQPY